VGTPPCACFTHATDQKQIDSTGAPKYVQCLLGHESGECVAVICS